VVLKSPASTSSRGTAMLTWSTPIDAYGQEPVSRVSSRLRGVEL
jgi:hypothetical protein